MRADDTNSGRRGGELNAALVRELVHRNAAFTGHGPAKARAFYNGNVLVVILEGAMTPAEHSLAADGKSDVVLGMRREVQLALRPNLEEAVEELTGCRVLAFMSDSHVQPDITTEVFVLDRPVPY
jgi:uncharacterized protein YbcI